MEEQMFVKVWGCSKNYWIVVEILDMVPTIFFLFYCFICQKTVRYLWGVHMYSQPSLCISTSKWPFHSTGQGESIAVLQCCWRSLLPTQHSLFFYFFTLQIWAECSRREPMTARHTYNTPWIAADGVHLSCISKYPWGFREVHESRAL